MLQKPIFWLFDFPFFIVKMYTKPNFCYCVLHKSHFLLLRSPCLIPFLLVKATFSGHIKLHSVTQHFCWTYPPLFNIPCLGLTFRLGQELLWSDGPGLRRGEQPAEFACRGLGPSPQRGEGDDRNTTLGGGRKGGVQKADDRNRWNIMK